jgi:hypothetical protein
MMMIVATVTWECLKKYCICRRTIVAEPTAIPLLQETTTSVITSTQEEPTIVMPEPPARIVRRNQTTTDIYVSRSGRANRLFICTRSVQA